MSTRLFPYETVRDEQDKLIAAVQEALRNGGQLAVHAPTGLGKTAGVLAPAIEHALDADKTVLFLTSRLTQHALALRTVEQIGERHSINIPVVDLVGKKHMCLQQGVEGLTGKEFSDYCKAMREDGVCEFYERLKQDDQPSPATKSVLVQLGKKRAARPEDVKALCADQRLCPYEITMLHAARSSVVIMDYSYLFNPKIREGFLRRIGTSLSECIVIVDEGHNLPDRVKDLATERITRSTITRAAKELENAGESGHVHHVRQIGELVAGMAKNTEEERHVSREEFLSGVARICPAEHLIKDLQETAASVREEQKSSSCGALADFLAAWHGPDEGYVRILAVKRSEQGVLAGAREAFWQLSYRCLDPSVVTKPVFDDACASVVMSGTLTPVGMYAELLGLSRVSLETLSSPFPNRNRLNIVVPKTTTKYAARTEQMYGQIAAVCAELVETIPGNVAVFFPSYALLQEIKERIETKTGKTVLAEHSGLTREERQGVLDRFRALKETGSVLLAVMGGSFSEGIDLPGRELRGVVIVGLPLGRPDLETKALIDYYQEQFGKGWEYGYTFPAFNRTLQSAGRCIRTETDKGVIVFLDERYAWESYYKCFPKDWNIRISLRYGDMIREFFGEGPGTSQ